MNDHDDQDEGVLEEFPGTAKATAAALKPEPVEPAIELPNDLLDLDSVGQYTQQLRVRAIRQINKAIAQEASSELFSVLLKAAGDMDKTVVNRRRVGIEEEAAKTSEQSQRDTAAILRSLASKANPFMVDPANQDPNRKPPTLGDDVPPITSAPGETEIGTQQLSYDGFAKELPPV